MRQIEDLEHYLKSQARAEAEMNISATLGEFMGEDPDNPSGWDARGLSSWAMSRFHVSLSQGQIRKMDPVELEEKLRQAAIEQIDKRDCSPLLKYLEPLYAEGELARWAREKFAIEVAPEEFMADAERGMAQPAEVIGKLIEDRARRSYARREMEYPIDQALVFAFGGPENTTDNPYAADYLRAWARAKYGIELSLDHIRSQGPHKLHQELVGYQREFLNEGRLEKEIDAMIASSNGDRAELLRRFNERFPLNVSEKDLSAKRSTSSVKPNGDEKPNAGIRPVLLEKARAFLRKELTDLEQFVLIQILDQAWKDHLYAMDMLKGGIGLKAFAEQDPRVAFKREGFQYFEQMMIGVRDKVTDLIFRARVAGAAQARSAYNVTAATHQEGPGYGVSENVAANAQGIDGAGEMQQASDQPQGQATAVKTIVRETPKVGRNDPCPCGSGKKYKKCHGADAA
jgi:preprotein translocase subunit SecA